MRFNELRLSQPILRAVVAEGYTTPTPIQARAIPQALAGRDVLGCAQTGTGKTCAFALPILHRLAEATAEHGPSGRKGRRGRAPRALILCPTRELAMQIYESFIVYGRNLSLRHAVVFGGVSQGRQVRTLAAGVDVLVATPGRLLDLINQGYINLREIEVLVLDEADRMLDMGFMPDIRKIIKMLPRRRQTLFFSATVPKEIRRLTDSILQNPVFVETAPESSPIEAVEQRVHMVERKDKPRVLEHLLRQEEVRRALVFTRTKHGADKLVKLLGRSGINVEAIHGNKTQNARTRAMRRFKSGSTRVLIATDIASRGIDVDEITHVVNFDMPIDPETYVHRIGRTARAGASGVAVSFCDREERGILRAIERRIRTRLEVIHDKPDFADQATTSPEQERPRDDRPRESSTTDRFRKPKPKGKYRKSSTNGTTWKSKSNGRSRKPKANGQSGKVSAGGGNWKSKSSDRSGKPTANGNSQSSSPTGRKRKFSSTGKRRKTKVAGRRNTSGRAKMAAPR